MIKQSESLLQAIQSEILEGIATGQQFEAVSDLLCRRVESIAPGAVCSILIIDDNGLLQPVCRRTIRTRSPVCRSARR
jgi:hypothetical protein